MRNTPYYSVRKGLNPRLTNLDLPLLCSLFLAMYRDFDQRGYFVDAFGYSEGSLWYPGYIADLGNYFLRKLRKPQLWPIETRTSYYSEDDLFDVIELVYDLVDKPKGAAITPSDARIPFRGGVASRFGREAGQAEFRAEVNEILRDYKSGYELSPDGEILEIADIGLESLLKTELPQLDPLNVEARVEAAVPKFRRRHSSLDDRRDAVKSLVEVLEFLRPKLKTVITRKDESDLFNIANNFGIRHHNTKQKMNYDQAVWLSWMFYFYLATIHAVTRLIKNGKEG